MLRFLWSRVTRAMVKNICGIIILETRSPQDARKFSEQMKNCPSLVASGTTGKTIYSVYVVPEEKRWWLKYPESHPEITGSVTARVHVLDNLVYPEQFPPRFPTAKTATAPCGADCPSCPLREQYACAGCPATIHYRTSQRIKQ